MKKDLSLLLQSIALSALAGIQQQATATSLEVTSESTSTEIGLRLKVLKVSLAKPSFILRAINTETGSFEGSFHRSHRSHASHRSHYSSYSGSAGSSSGSSSSGSSGIYSPPASSYSSGSSSSNYPSGTYSAPRSSTSPFTPTAYRLGDRLLYLGMKGSDVLQLKTLLIQQGYYSKTSSNSLSEVFDDDTRTAVKKLQHANKLTEDCMVDPVVVAYLNSGSPAAVKPSLLGNRLLQWGLSGPDVVELKTKLIQKGYLKSVETPTDRFDEATEQAVKSLQRANGMVVTGQVTEAVIKLLP